MAKETVAEDRDGTLALQGGQLILTEPEGEGSYPTIAPGKGVKIWISAQEIEKPTPVTAVTQVKIEPLKREGKREIKVVVSPDKLQATLEVHYDPGENYSLPELKATKEARIVGIRQKGLPPITMGDVKEEIAAQGVCVGIDEEALRRAVEKADGKPVVVAMGTPPGESIDARIEHLFSLEERIIKPVGDERIDYRERIEIPTVPPGTRIAVKHPSHLGDPGQAVTGEAIEARIPKEVEMIAGKGVEITPDGREALSTIGGRPMLKRGGRLEVMAVLVERGDVSLTTGNVNFHGDVEVHGRVTENMKVTAGGNITVYRNVNHASLEAAGSIIIKGNLIGGTIRAGGVEALYRQIQPILEVLLPQLQELKKALAQLLQLPQFQAQARTSGSGAILHLLIEQKFPQVPALAGDLAQHVEGEQVAISQEERELILNMKDSLRGINVQRLREKDLEYFCQGLLPLLEKVQEADSQPADISLHYAQNASIEATGLVTIQGQGSYHTRIVAGQGLSVSGNPGIVRGGVIQSFGNVTVKEAGSPGGTPTIITCSKEFHLDLGRVYPNVTIQVGRSRHKFTSETTGIRARLVEGELRLS